MKKRTILTKFVLHWLPPVIGGIVGVIYAIVDEQLIKELFGISTPAIIVFAHNILDFVLPIVIGILIGFGIIIMQRQVMLNRKLSIQNTKFQRDLLINTLTSLFLHEIRNPIHNIAAALDDGRIVLPDELGTIIDRNLKRLEQITLRYRKWSSLFDKIDPKEKTELRPWLKEFIDNNARFRLRELNVEFMQEIDGVTISMHPFLLEQSFSTLFSNACEALAKEPNERHLLLISRLQAPDYKKVEIKLINRGHGFSEEVLNEQGHSPVQSKNGLGLGLTLLRKIMEQVEGEMFLSNSNGHAEVTLLVPGESE